MTQPTWHPEAELSDLLDGELDARTRETVEAHLRDCPACATLLEELRAVAVQAHALEPREPETDLWPGIARRIGATPAVVPIPARARAFQWRFSLSLPQLAAAVFMVALISGGTVWWVLRTSAPTPALPVPATMGAPAAGVAAANFDTRQYDLAVRELQQVLAQNHDRLDPQTVRTVEANLAAIDAAIAQARSALAADPASPYLGSYLAEQMKRKIRVLQRAADAVTADYSGADS